MPQPGGEGGWIETDRAADLETGNAIFGGEFVNLAFGYIQEFGNIGDGEGIRPPIERVGQIHSYLLHNNRARAGSAIMKIICPGFSACLWERSATIVSGRNPVIR